MFGKHLFTPVFDSFVLNKNMVLPDMALKKFS